MPGIMGLLPKKQASSIEANGSKYGILVIGAGGEIVEHEVVEVAGYNEGYAMRYLDGNKMLEVVYVPRGYKFREQNGVKLVGKRFGNNSACPIMFLGESVDKDCPGADLSAVGRADLVARGINTLTGKQAINWKWILIIGGVAVVAVLLYMRFGR